MTLHPEPIPTIPPETARVAQAAFPKGNAVMRMRDELGTFYTDQTFATLFPTRGQPAETPWRLALILVLQYVEGVSDQQAAEAVRSRIDWKYALSLALTDPGFDASVLSEFRTRLVAGQAEHLLLETMLERFKHAGLLKARGRQRTDATHVLAVSRQLNRLECVGETMRHALNTLAIEAPDWLRTQLDPAWRERYERRFNDYRLPQARAARVALAEQIGLDGWRLYTTLTQPDAPTWLRTLPAIETLRQVWLQQYRFTDTTLNWRTGEETPPAARMINSPYDVEARYGVKRGKDWVGYKAHVTETCDVDMPHLITHVATTPASTSDATMPDTIHQALATKQVLPGEHLLDAGYVSSEAIVTAQTEHQVEVVGPVPPNRHWQARSGKGFEVACFAIDWEQQQVTCPQGRTSRQWHAITDQRGHPLVHIQFARAECAACPCRVDCTKSKDKGRTLIVRPQAQHQALHAARQYQQTDSFKTRYQARAGIEGTLSQGIRVCDLRHARYVGQAKTHLQHVLIAAALNVHRIGAWFADESWAKTRQAPFVKLMQPGALHAAC